jgi:hypothetical protein
MAIACIKTASADFCSGGPFLWNKGSDTLLDQKQENVPTRTRVADSWKKLGINSLFALCGQK